MTTIDPIPNYPDFLEQLNQLPIREYTRVMASDDLLSHFKDELYVEGEVLIEYLGGIPWEECPLCETNPIYAPGTRIVEDVELVKPCEIHRKDTHGNL